MTKYLYSYILLFSLLTFEGFSQNTNKWGTNPKLNAPINNPALMGVFNPVQITGNYTMAYQTVQYAVIQQHLSSIDFMQRIQSSKTAIGGGAKFEKTYSNDFEDAVLAYGVWLSLGHHWDFKNNTHFGIGLTIGHQKSEIQYFSAAYQGFPNARNFTKEEKEDKESLISNLGFSYYGNTFFLSLSNTGFTGMYDFNLENHTTLSLFGGISHLNYYENRTYSYYIGLEFKPLLPVTLGSSWSSSFYGQELKGVSAYAQYTFKMLNFSYSASNNQIYFEDFGVYHENAWVHSFTLSYLI